MNSETRSKFKSTPQDFKNVKTEIHKVNPSPYSPNYSQEHSLSLSPIFVNRNVTQLLIGLTEWFSQSEVALHSNASKYSQEHSLSLFLRFANWNVT